MDLNVSIGRLKLRNPVLVASGTFGYGDEYKDLVDITKLGAIITKTITPKLIPGSAPPRLYETASGMLNSIGLENKGVDFFIKEKLPYLQKSGAAVIVSIGAHSPEQFGALAEKLSAQKGIAAIEINISCPNIEYEKCEKMFAQDRGLIETIVGSVRKATKLPVITKLSPNVTDITIMAKAAEAAGSDAVSLVNTFKAMAVDIDTRKPVLGNITGGLSGPAIKPIALRMVWEVYNAVKIPVIGIGGIMSWQDAVEFIICGATAVEIGTGTFVNPKTSEEIISGLQNYCQEHSINNIADLKGTLKVK